MPLYKEDNFLIISPGSESTYFSFGLKDTLSPPQFRIPTVVYQDQTSNEYFSTKVSEDNANTSTESDTSASASASANVNSNTDTNPTSSINSTRKEIWPIRDSKIVDLDAFNALLRIILSSVIKQHPILTINQIPMLLIAPSLTWSKRQVEYITKYVFEKLEITAFNVVDLSLAATFSIGGGTVNTTVVHVSENNTQIVPVIGYQAIRFSGLYIKDAGENIIIEEFKQTSNREDLSTFQIKDLLHSGVFEFLHEGQETFHNKRIDKTTDGKDDEEFDVAKTVVNTDGAEEADDANIKNNRDLENNYFIDSRTKEKITVGKERFVSTSKLVDIVTKGIYDTLLGIDDLDRRQDCYDNIILVGSVFQIPGFKLQVITKLMQDYLVTEPPTEKQNGNTDAAVNAAIARYQQSDDFIDDANNAHLLLSLSQVPNNISLAKFPDYFPEWKKPKALGGSWQDVYFLGGEIYAKQIFSGGSHHHNKELFVGSDMYEERGPQSIWDVTI